MSKPDRLAVQMAHAIQRFRNLPMLKNQSKLRETMEYGDLCLAWEDFVYKHPEVRLSFPVRDVNRKSG